jgi:hypothetical protein
VETVIALAAIAPAANCVDFSRKFRRVAIPHLPQLAELYTRLGLIYKLKGVDTYTSTGKSFACCQKALRGVGEACSGKGSSSFVVLVDSDPILH